MPIYQRIRALVDEATALGSPPTPWPMCGWDARLCGDTRVQLVDIRDLARAGARRHRFPGCIHMPRGMLEFWSIRPAPISSPQAFAGESKWSSRCSAAQRAGAVAGQSQTLQHMGLTNVGTSTAVLPPEAAGRNWPDPAEQDQACQQGPARSPPVGVQDARCRLGDRSQATAAVSALHLGRQGPNASPELRQLGGWLPAPARRPACAWMPRP